MKNLLNYRDKLFFWKPMVILSFYERNTLPRIAESSVKITKNVHHKKSVSHKQGQPRGLSVAMMQLRFKL